MKITSNDLQRFSKQIILKEVGIIGQKKISSARVLIIGAGGLGCPLMLYLANTGIGNIGIVDNDKINISNLNRQVLFTPSDVGKYKVTQAKKIIKKINKKIKVTVFKKKLNTFNIRKICDSFDIICDSSDNFITRYLINDYCLKKKKILVSAAINKFDGQVFSFNFKKNIPCFRCFMPEAPTNENNCDDEGIIPAIAGVAGTLQANEVINNITRKKNNMTGKMLLFNLLTYDFRKIKLTKNPDCIKICRK
jgi:molybdopterin/thiamine biosynthesis adenylyltransferase